MTSGVTGSDLPSSPGAAGRDTVIDIARGLAIILVLVGHSLEMGFLGASDFGQPFPSVTFDLWRLIYAFHMPVFFLVSGMTYRDGEADLAKVVASSLVLIAIAYGTSLLAAPLVHHLKPDAGSLLELVVKPLVTGYQMNLVVTWFLVSLAFCQILTWMFYAGSIPAKLSAVGIAVAAYAVMDLAGKNYYYAKSWIFALVFFVCGRELARARLHRRGGTAVAALVLLVASALLFLTYGLNHGCALRASTECGTRWGPEFAVVMAAGEVGNVLAFFVAAFAGIGVVLAASRILDETGVGAAFASIGRMTLAILLVNGVFLVFAREWVATQVGDGARGVAVIVVSVLAQLVVAIPLNPPILRLRRAGERVVRQWLAARRWSASV